MEDKLFIWKNKQYTLLELIKQEGFTVMKYDSSAIKNDKQLTYLEKQEGKWLYRLPISIEEYYKLKVLV